MAKKQSVEVRINKRTLTADPVAIDFAAGFHQAIASGMCIGDASSLTVTR
jgi:hypothetical protein